MPEFFFPDIVGRIKCPAYIGCGDTPTRNTNLVNLTELEMSIFYFVVVFVFVFVFLFCVCVCVCVCVYRHFHGFLKGYFNIKFTFVCLFNKIHYSFCVCVCVCSYWLFCRKD